MTHTYMINACVYEPGYRALIVVPTEKDALNTLLELERDLAMGLVRYRRIARLAREVQFHNGSVIRVAVVDRARDTQAYKGMEFDSICYDDYDRISAAAYIELQHRLR